MDIHYAYDKVTGAFAGSGGEPTDTETHGSTLDAPPNGESLFKNGRWLRALPAWRVRAAVAVQGLADDIEALFAGMAQPAQSVAREAWNGNVISQASPLLVSAAAALGLSAEQVDGIFDLAESFDA